VDNRVLEIVVFLMSHIRDHQGKLENIDDISSYLKSNGFTDNEISSAYSWVVDQIQVDSQSVLNGNQSSTASRVLTNQERHNFSAKAIGYLLQLRHLGIINDAHIELILERGSILGSSKIDLEQMKIIIGSLLFRDSEFYDVGKQQVLLIPDDEGPVN
jgi:uncharacterized protein Smg (DUF494 family)